MRANRGIRTTTWFRGKSWVEAGSALAKLHYPCHFPPTQTNPVLDQRNAAQPWQNGSCKDVGRAPLSSCHDKAELLAHTPQPSAFPRQALCGADSPQPQAPRAVPRHGGIPPDKEQQQRSGRHAERDRFAWKYQHPPLGSLHRSVLAGRQSLARGTRDNNSKAARSSGLWSSYFLLPVLSMFSIVSVLQFRLRKLYKQLTSAPGSKRYLSFKGIFLSLSFEAKYLFLFVWKKEWVSLVLVQGSSMWG